MIYHRDTVEAQGGAPSRSKRAGPLDGDAVWLGLVPAGVALVFGLLLLPRAVVPRSVPLPIPDAGALTRVAAADHALAQSARVEPLPGAVRALGSTIRAFHLLEAKQADLREIGAARHDVDAQLPDALAAGEESLLRLRAVELEGFLEELRKFEATGEESPELAALGGGFVRSMRADGWCDGHTLAAGPGALRAMFKQMWSSFLGLEGRPAFAPSLDETRALYALYLERPHPSARLRESLEGQRRGARNANECAAAAAAERRAVERWRLERIERLGAIDPTYPVLYARGVASYGAGNYEAATEALRDWLHAHPDGPLTLRAHAYLRAAAAAASVD